MPKIHYMAGVENWSEHDVQKQTPAPAKSPSPVSNYNISSFHMIHKHIKHPQIQCRLKA
jgi:hypothetical protein